MTIQLMADQRKRDIRQTVVHQLFITKDDIRIKGSKDFSEIKSIKQKKLAT